MKPKRKMAKVDIELKPHSVKGEFWLIFQTGHHPTILWLKRSELVRLKTLIEGVL